MYGHELYLYHQSLIVGLFCTTPTKNLVYSKQEIQKLETIVITNFSLKDVYYQTSKNFRFSWIPTKLSHSLGFGHLPCFSAGALLLICSSHRLKVEGAIAAASATIQKCPHPTLNSLIRTAQ